MDKVIVIGHGEPAISRAISIIKKSAKTPILFIDSVGGPIGRPENEIDKMSISLSLLKKDVKTKRNHESKFHK